MRKGFGRIVTVKIVDQFNSHDVIFKGYAHVDNRDEMERYILGPLRRPYDEEELRKLFAEVQLKGFPDVGGKNRDFLFGKE